jgi:predicted O-methyltransferase YrrM
MLRECLVFKYKMKIFRLFRKWFWVKARNRNKNILVTPRVNAYVDDFLLKSETSEMKAYLSETQKMFSAGMQSPLGEARFISILIKAVKAKRVLELGTFRGFTTAEIAQALPNDGELVTCEFRHEHAEYSSKWFLRLGLDKKIKVLEGRGVAILNDLIKENQKFDVIFIDANKSDYKTYLDQSLQLIKPGGLILADNTLWASLVTYDKSEDKMADWMKDFNDYVFEKMGSKAVILPIWDGLTIIVA